MADLTAAAVTIERQWTEGGTSGKEITCMEVTLVLPGQGGLTDKIPATLFGISKLEQAVGFRRDSNEAMMAAPSYDGANLILFNVETVTDADRGLAVNVADTIRGVVKGLASQSHIA
jgi:hypothetical protein